MPRATNPVDYACPVERRRSTDFQSPWDALVFVLSRMLALFGLAIVAWSVGLATGYWWAKSGEKYFLQAVKADAGTTDCGSCKKGQNK